MPRRGWATTSSRTRSGAASPECSRSWSIDATLLRRRPRCLVTPGSPAYCPRRRPPTAATVSCCRPFRRWIRQTRGSPTWSADYAPSSRPLRSWGASSVENLDLKAQLDRSTPLVIGVILVLGFLLVLVALQAPLVALLGTAVSLLSTAGAFGLARLVFQDGHGAGLLGFEHQGFLDAWAPVFFFAMIFAIAMDYTVFLLAAAKEQWELTGDPHLAMVGALAHSGRVIFAAGGVMVAVFFTFASAGQLPVKEMGTILGLAVLLDAFVVRLTLLPVLLRLTGRAAWYTPRWLTRVLPAITFSHG